MSALERIFPRVIDNTPPSRAAMWILGAVTLLRGAQSVAILLRGGAMIRDADGVPVDTFTPAAYDAVVGTFAIAAVLRFVMVALGVLVLLRYRRAVGLMLLVIAVEYVARELSLSVYPITRVGSPAGPIVNRALLLASAIGVVLVAVGKDRQRAEP